MNKSSNNISNFRNEEKKIVILFAMLAFACLLTLFIPRPTFAANKTLKVTINANGGYFHGKRVLKDYFWGYTYGNNKVSYDSFLNGYSFPYRKGYAFTGFYFNKKCTKPIYSNENVFRKAVKKANGKITIYAGWTKKCVKVTFDLGRKGWMYKDYKNGYVSTDGKVVRYVKRRSAVSSAIPAYALRDLAPETKSGYRFVGWYRDKRYKHRVNLATYKPKKKVTLYAKYIRY